MNEELERKNFEAWFSEVQRPAMIKVGIRMIEQELVRDIARMAWMSRAKQESNDE
jgi:hypothetical protein